MTKPAQVASLADFAHDELGSIDLWCVPCPALPCPLPCQYTTFSASWQHRSINVLLVGWLAGLPKLLSEPWLGMLIAAVGQATQWYVMKLAANNDW